MSIENYRENANSHACIKQKMYFPEYALIYLVIQETIKVIVKVIIKVIVFLSLPCPLPLESTYPWGNFVTKYILPLHCM